MARESRTLKLSILADVDKLKQSLNIGSKDVDGFAGKIGDFSKKAALAFAAVAAAAGAMAIKIGVDAVKAASDLGETISKVNVLFGDTAKDIEKFAEGAATSLGQTKQQALDAAATFATFGKSAGLSGKDLSKFSIDFVKLSSDLASFNNTSPEQAINAIGSALRGEAEPLRAYGVLLDDASLRQAALELGIISTTKNALTPQQKVLAAQALIYQQTGAAQGDFERTSDGLANKTRILTAQLENAKTTIGTALLPIVLELATLFSDKVIPIVEKVTNAFGSKSEGMGGTLKNLADSIKGFVQPIFEGFKSAFDSIKKTVIENKDEFQSFFDLIKSAAPIIGNVIGAAFRIIGDVASVVLNVFANVLGALKGLINTAIDFINVVIRGLNIINPGKDIPYLGKLGTTAGSTATGPLGNFSMSTGRTSTTTTSVASAASAASMAASAAANSLTSPAAKKAVNEMISKSFNPARFRQGEEKSMLDFLVTSFDVAQFRQGEEKSMLNAIEKIKDYIAIASASQSLANEFMGAGVADPTELFNFNGQMVKGVIDATGISDAEAAFRQQEALLFRMANPDVFAPIIGPEGNSQAANITVNVNGAIDPEGTARTIVDTLNNSFYRGTNGALNFAS